MVILLLVLSKGFGKEIFHHKTKFTIPKIVFFVFCKLTMKKLILVGK